MDSYCVPLTEFPRTSRLFADYVYHFDHVKSFYAGSPLEPDAYRQAAGAIDYPPPRRAAMVEALRRRNPGNPSLERLAKRDTVAVVTGQQVGLFTGPCYTVYKALTALKLARELTASGLEAVPVFWMATEDHDFAEISRCWSFNERQQPVFLQLHAEDGGAGPVGGVRLEAPPLNELRTSLSRLPYGDEIATIAEISYAPGRTLADAFRSLLQQFLPGEILFLDPLDQAIRDVAAPFLVGALHAAPELNRLLRQREQELASAGYHAQVHIDPNNSLLFRLAEGRRVPLRLRGAQFLERDRVLETTHLVDEPVRLSPNAVLRPVMQDYLLPTVACVGGPAEIAYFAQSEVLYRTLLGRMPVVVPRASFTVLDARAEKLMKRHDLSLGDFFQGPDVLVGRVAATLIPGDLEESLVNTTESVMGHVDELRSKLKSFDPTLGAAVEKSRAKIIHQLVKVERKVARQALLREDRAEADAERLYNLIYPRKHPQERLYTILPFLARHGFDIIRRIEDNVRPDRPGHVVLRA